ncbi:MAG: cobalamin biosynthesis bifunctional protein CbiET [Planctomycetaceae bacterium]|nr:cobalamin biosynthesis bifunctional protein CbiET [Planctomycetaceae bacterium]
MTSRATKLIESADLLIGPTFLTSLFAESVPECWDAGPSFDDIALRLENSTNQQIVILAAGDPLFYGTARYLCDRLGKERFEVIPHVSTMQLAFARVKESWDEAYLTNLATQPLERVISKIRSAERVGVFTSADTTPSDLAVALLQARIDYFTAYVCENLGSPDERVTSGDLKDFVDTEFSLLNVMILLRNPDVPDRPTEMQGRRVFGNPDEIFLQSKPKRGLLTNSEIRVMALAELDLGPTSIIWDIGAGSGSVAIEAALLAPGGHVYAVEMDTGDYELIRENSIRFGLENVTAVLGQAPDAWSDLPAPDAIFIGGTGRQLVTIVSHALNRLKSGGRIVADMASIDNLYDVQAVLRKETGDVNILMVNISRGNYQLERLSFDALTPKFLVSAIKP